MATRRDGSSTRREGLTAEEDGGEDWLSTLPDEILHNVLSFLPAHEAVWTCVLSRRWRNLWRSAPVLRIRYAERWDGMAKFDKFVNNLLLLRDPVPLDELEFQTVLGICQLHPLQPSFRLLKYANTWIRHALMCNVRVLRVLVQYQYDLPLLKVNMPLISEHLKTLELRRVLLDKRTLDFSSCPSLEDLEMNSCGNSTANKILSQSLKRLCITNGQFADDLSSLPALQDLEMESCGICTEKVVCQSLKHLCLTQCHFEEPTHISAPGLISLQLNDIWGWTPSLETMPLLVIASVKLWKGSMGCCSECTFHPGTCADCDGDPDSSFKCEFLRDLSNAVNLELAAEDGMCMFKQDLTWCPRFSKVKTLLLDGWVVGHDFYAVVCFLQHTPILEKLTLQLCEGHERMVEIEESSRSVGRMVQFEHLQTVEVRCLRNDEWVHKILKILNTYGITPDKITIQIQKSTATAARKRSSSTEVTKGKVLEHLSQVKRAPSVQFRERHGGDNAAGVELYYDRPPSLEDDEPAQRLHRLCFPAVAKRIKLS
uniref:F-box domain-containing protein n=1 Tax=Oryza rufipogon TaxID=4529 RepID=A0A0E0R5C9_ORYRU